MRAARLTRRRAVTRLHDPDVLIPRRLRAQVAGWPEGRGRRSWQLRLPAQGEPTPCAPVFHAAGAAAIACQCRSEPPTVRRSQRYGMSRHGVGQARRLSSTQVSPPRWASRTA